jgi:hypothetical protein
MKKNAADTAKITTAESGSLSDMESSRSGGFGRPPGRNIVAKDIGNAAAAGRRAESSLSRPSIEAGSYFCVDESIPLKCLPQA